MSETWIKITDCEEDSTAASIGILKDDYIIELNNNTLQDIKHFKELLELSHNKEAKFLISRNSEEISISCEKLPAKPLGIKFIGEKIENNIIKTYSGNPAIAEELFVSDAELMLQKGYHPVSKNYVEGQYGLGSFLIALLFCLVIIGFIVFIYMLIVKPDGVLTVTYERKSRKKREKKLINQIRKFARTVPRK